MADRPERGGRGSLLEAIVRAQPGVHGTLFDQAHVVADVEIDGVDVVAGSFFEAVLRGGDVASVLVAGEGPPVRAFPSPMRVIASSARGSPVSDGHGDEDDVVAVVARRRMNGPPQVTSTSRGRPLSE